MKSHIFKSAVALAFFSFFHFDMLFLFLLVLFVVFFVFLRLDHLGTFPFRFGGLGEVHLCREPRSLSSSCLWC